VLVELVVVVQVEHTQDHLQDLLQQTVVAVVEEQVELQQAQVLLVVKVL